MGDGEIGRPTNDEIPIARKLRAHIRWSPSELDSVVRLQKR
jgi:hypothetical protein